MTSKNTPRPNHGKSATPVPVRRLASLVAAVSGMAYFNTLFNGFVRDDIQQILGNPWIKRVAYIPDIFFGSVWEFMGTIGNYYRPMMHLMYLLDYQLFRYDAWGYHLVNVLFNAGVCVIVFLLLVRVQRTRAPGDPGREIYVPFAASLLFATHPIHTEAVAWVAALPEVTYSFFSLLSLQLYIRATQDPVPPRGAFALSVVAFFVAALCKEPALMLPLILAAYDHSIAGTRPRPLALARRYLPFMAAAGLYFILRFNALGGFTREPARAELTNYQYLINGFPLFMEYMRKLVLPVGLNSFYLFEPIRGISEATGIVSAVFTLGYLLATGIAYKKNKMVFFGLAFIAVPLLPALYIKAIMGDVVFAERYLYLPSFGFVIVLSALMNGYARLGSRRTAVLAAALAVATIFAAATIRRNTVWRDGYTLWADVAAKSPQNDIAHTNLGYALCFEKNKVDEGIRHLRIALEINPEHPASHVNIGSAYLKKGLTAEAIEHFRRALALRPGFDKAHYSMALAYESQGLKEETVAEYEKALRSNPYFIDARVNLAVAYAEIGMLDRSIENLEFAAKLDPDDPQIHYNLAKAHQLRGNADEAIAHLEQARRLERE